MFPLRYNNRSYTISDVDFDLSPRSQFKRENGTLVSYIDYYKQVRSHGLSLNVGSCMNDYINSTEGTKLNTSHRGYTEAAFDLFVQLHKYAP